jgi:hypothetical protein
MSVLVTLAAAYAICRLLPRVIAEIVATFVGTLLAFRCSRSRQALLVAGATSTSNASWDHRPSRARRRAFRRSLHASLDMTAFTSLLPHLAARACSLASGIDYVLHAAGHGLTRLRVSGLDPVQRG